MAGLQDGKMAKMRTRPGAGFLFWAIMAGTMLAMLVGLVVNRFFIQNDVMTIVVFTMIVLFLAFSGMAMVMEA
jgi:hypothetical protein